MSTSLIWPTSFWQEFSFLRFNRCSLFSARQRHFEEHSNCGGKWPGEDGMAFEVLSRREAVRILGIHRALSAFRDARYRLLLRWCRILHHRWRRTETILLRIQRLQHCWYVITKVGYRWIVLGRKLIPVTVQLWVMGSLMHTGEKAMVGLHDYVKRSKLLEEEDVLLPNNTLTLFFKLSLCSSPESEG